MTVTLPKADPGIAQSRCWGCSFPDDHGREQKSGSERFGRRPAAHTGSVTPTTTFLPLTFEKHR